MRNKHNVGEHYLKQESEADKHICEVFSSQFMRFIAAKIGENPHIIADVSYKKIKLTQAPFKDEVHIASKLFTGYRDLYLDAYLAYQLPAYQPLRKIIKNKWATLPKTRPRYLEHDLCIETMLKAGRYKDFSVGMALRTIVDDPDTHFKNIGVRAIKPSALKDIIPIYENGYFSGYGAKKKRPSHINHDLNDPGEINIGGVAYYTFPLNHEPSMDEFKEAFVKDKGQYYLIPNMSNTQAVHVDFGGSLGDFRFFSRRKLDSKLHLRSFYNRLRYHPSFSGPPGYQDQIPDALTGKATCFFETLARYSMIDKDDMANFIHQQIGEAMTFYQDNPQISRRFAERIGLNKYFIKKLNLKDLGTEIKNYLLCRFMSRQKHAKHLFLEYFCHLDYSTQLNLSNSYKNSNTSNESNLKETLSKRFFNQLREENQEFFATFAAIETLNLNLKHDKNTPILLWELKEQLHAQLSQAYLANELDNAIPKIKKIIAQTKHLLETFIETKTQLAMSISSDKHDAHTLIEKFTRTAHHYKQTCNQASIAECIRSTISILADALIGALVSLAIGIMISSALLAPLAIFVGARMAYKVSQHPLFSSLNPCIKELSHALTTDVTADSPNALL